MNMHTACLVGTVVRRWISVLEVVGSNPALAKQRIYFSACYVRSAQDKAVSRPEWDFKRSLVSLVAQVSNQCLWQVELL